MPTPRVYDDQPCPRKYCYADDRAHCHWHNADHSRNTAAPVHHMHCYPSREPDAIRPDVAALVSAAERRGRVAALRDYANMLAQREAKIPGGQALASIANLRARADEEASRG